MDVAQKQYELTKAGAWSYDINNQERQYQALKQAYEAANALLVKYAVKAPVDGVVLAVNATAGSYVSSQGAYDPYTELFGPLVIMGPRGPSGRALLRGQDTGLTAAVSVAYSRTDVRPQNKRGIPPETLTSSNPSI